MKRLLLIVLGVLSFIVSISFLMEYLVSDHTIQQNLFNQSSTIEMNRTNNTNQIDYNYYSGYIYIKFKKPPFIPTIQVNESKGVIER